MRDARMRRWPTQKSFAAATRVPVKTLGDVENGRRGTFGEATLGPIEDALDWPRGSIRRYAVEGVPIRPLPDPALERIHTSWHRLSPDARNMLAKLAETTAQR